MRKALVLLSMVAIWLASAPVLACGESLYRVGKGIIYREYTAPLPGKILVVAENAQEQELAKALIRAGHTVSVVANTQAITNEVTRSQFDIVMSRYELQHVVVPALAQSTTAYLPVARAGTAEVDQVRSQYPRLLKDSDNIKQFLIQIHRTLKTRNT